MRPKLPGSQHANFLKTQWWLGLRVGMNYVNPDLRESFSSINPIDYEADELSKSYESFNLPGVILGLDISLYHKGFLIGIQPSFKQMRYSYSSDLNWTGDTPNEEFSTRYKSEQTLNYLELPATLRYEIIHEGPIRPFLLAGGFYSFRIGGEKETQLEHTENTTGTPRSFSGGTIVLNSKDQFKNYAGFIVGVGTGFHIFNIRTNLEIAYNHALTSITNDKTRFDVSELSTLGEVNDDVNIHNISASLSFIFPLRYIDKTFQAY